MDLLEEGSASLRFAGQLPSSSEVPKAMLACARARVCVAWRLAVTSWYVAEKKQANKQTNKQTNQITLTGALCI